ncbi:glycoside hydrolase family 3 N-terminal domain-containing protein [Rathayibacter sp. VKM Ac-2760]|uniref:glycoside hydrolase family 3 N-terminal domain-containing protein n=1 Tax=Rathayibacter sp. VKM Ac-2760 TaxID=2609253 RepID=UPI0013182A3D|nr:glycoside hydrolase family 3 N-terminal domain-containing protein [Rathayibacter sp. VKM Ac-2760]QHC61070.1 beta-glucosidase [Rathayibacter sp. VKM Ac-2760]
MTTPSPRATDPLDGLTLEDSASLLSGRAFWTTRDVADVPSLLLTDGPHGVRRQTGAVDHLGIAPSEPATCFPPAVALAQTWDPALAERVGKALGAEARALGVSVLLGPGVNIKRDPRCGRNFEYFSEDPLVSAAMGSAWVVGLQSTGVGASLKHFAANNQETERMRVSADIDERPLHEIYLRAFERVVRDARPWTVMASYNGVNGIPVTEHRGLLTDILRARWGFDGVVVSDWGAVRDRVAALRAGLDLQMPGGDDDVTRSVVEAVEAGELDRSLVEESARRLVALAERTEIGRTDRSVVDHDAHHALAREVAGRAVVLLTNEAVAGEPLLPLAPSAPLAVIGGFAEVPRFQGGGSSKVTATRVDSPLDEIRALAGEGVQYARGFTTAADPDAERLRLEATDLAARCGTAVVFLGLATSQEAEGADRSDIELPAEQLALLESVARVQPRTVVVLSHGGVIRLRPVVELVPAIVDGAVLGQAVGGAIADVLFGVVNPAGRLAETVPLRLEDAPSYLDFPGEHLHVRYGEGVDVGYRGYDARGLAVEFPFGHGLSYTSFEHSDLELSVEDGGIRARVIVTNTGRRDGREVVQFYVTRPGRPTVRELKGFRSVDIPVGRATRVDVLIPRHELAAWDIRVHDWVVEGGDYLVAVGASSRDLRAVEPVALEGDSLNLPLTPDSSISELLATPIGAEILGPLLASASPVESAVEDELGIDSAATTAGIPLNRLRALSGGRGFTADQLDALLRRINA